MTLQLSRGLLIRAEMSNAIVQTTSHGSNGLLFAGWNQDQGESLALTACMDWATILALVPVLNT